MDNSWTTMLLVGKGQGIWCGICSGMGWCEWLFNQYGLDINHHWLVRRDGYAYSKEHGGVNHQKWWENVGFNFQLQGVVNGLVDTGVSENGVYLQATSMGFECGTS
jgi:hypothetical protein